MKKHFFVLIFSLGLLSLAPVAFAQTACPSGNDGDCPGDQVCDTSVTPYVCVASEDAATGAGNVQAGGACVHDGDCADNYACINSVCQYDPSLGDTGTAAAGGQCGQNDANGNPVECPGGQTCVSGVCQGTTEAPTTNSYTGFVPLAPIPGLDSTTDGTSASSLAQFLNNLYKYLIGLAAILAVIEIIWGGFEYATQDNISKKSDGRHRIEQALLGLVLILVPALVFGIINPSIKTLSLDLPPLNTAPGTPTQTVSGTPALNGKVSGVYLQRLTSNDPTSIQQFTNACGGAGGKLTNSCATTNSQTGLPNCSAASTLECENYAPYNSSTGTNQTVWVFFGAPSLADIIPNLKDSALFAVSTTALMPAVSAEIARDTQFISQCTADGGQVCTTDPTFTIENYDYISCPAASQQPAYSQPVGMQAYCFKMALFCADPNLPANGCTSGWSFQTSQ